MKSKGEKIAVEQEQKLLNEIKNRYDQQTTPYYAAARLWVDAIIDPVETRKVISEGISAANQNPDIAEMKLGVFQV
jgi:acetyl-CoA carboxylase carboxyltransferase component